MDSPEMSTWVSIFYTVVLDSKRVFKHLQGGGPLGGGSDDEASALHT